MEEIQEEIISETEELETVSDGDAGLALLEIPTDYVTVDALNKATEEIVSALSTEETVVTIWNKPLEEYTVEEGLLLLIFVLLLWFAIKQFIGGLFK